MKKIIPIMIIAIILQIQLATYVTYAETEDNIFVGIDISKNEDGSVIAKLSKDRRTLTISGTGEMGTMAGFSSPLKNYRKTITKININQGVQSIGMNAFEDLQNLREVTIPYGVTKISGYAFSGCSSLSSIEIPETVSNIYSSAFVKCESLNSIKVSSNNQNYESKDGVLFFTRETPSIACYPPGKSDTSYHIPDGVERIEEDAFWGCKSLKSVTIPDSVKRIEYSAFSECSNLNDVTIPKSVTEIYGGAFSKCSSLSSIEIPNSVKEIKYSLFSGCYSLSNITIPDGVTRIEQNAFSGCGLSSIEIPNSVKSIESSAFSNCKNLTSIKIPSSITTISDHVFSDCSNLKNIEIPDSVKIIERYAFENCTSIDNIVLPNNLSKLEGCIFMGANNLTTIEIPSSVTDIALNTFLHCENLKNINVNENNTEFSSINGVLFNKDKKNLIKYPKGKEEDNYTVPNGVENIGESAFSYCENLTDIKMNTGVINLGNYAFSYCENLTDITMNTGIISIGDYAFTGCTNLRNVKCANTLTTIGKSAFAGCNKLSNITNLDNVTSINDYAFSRCTNLRNFDISNKLQNVGSNAFEDCYLFKHCVENEIVLPNIIKRTMKENDILYSTSNLYLYNCEISENKEKIIILSNSDIAYLEVKNGALNGLRVYFIPAEIDVSVKNDKSVIMQISEDLSVLQIVGNGMMKDFSTTNYHLNAFGDKVTSVYIKHGVTNIGKDTFWRFWNIKNVDISDTVSKIDSSFLSDSVALRSINVDINNTNFSSEGGILFNKEKTKLIKYPPGKYEESYEIPNSVTEIVNDSFKRCLYLENVIMPDSVVDVGSAFRDCEKLKSIKLSNKTEKIPYMMFENCKELISIEIPNGVKEIEALAFENCRSLPNIEIPKSVVSIGGHAFENCISLSDIEIPDSVANIGNLAFLGCKNNIDVDKNNLNYMSEDGVLFNKNKTELIKYPKAKGNDFYIIPKGVIKICNSAFIDCEQLINIQIPYSIETIDRKAFAFCTNLKSLIIPKETTEINTDAFNECKNLAITCKSETTAERYAKENNIEYTTDDETPNLNVTYFPTTPTNKNVTVTITADEEIREITGWNLSEDRKTLMKTYEENATEEIIIMDLVGNEVKETIKVTNIDKVPPVVNKIQYSETKPTNKDVIIQIEVSEEIKLPEGWNYKANNQKNIITKTYTKNGQEEVELEDLVGNKASEKAKVKVSNIDKEVPKTVEVRYSDTDLTNKDVTVEIQLDEPVQTSEEWRYKTSGSNEDTYILTKTFSENAEEEVTIKDLAGNEIKQQVKITNIDKVAPKLTITYSNQSDSEIEVTITSDKEIQGIKDWNLSQDKKKLTKTYYNNITEEITVKDLLGNETKGIVKVEGIKNPIVEVRYSETKPTNKDVIVEIQFEEAVEEPEGWSYKTSQSTEDESVLIDECTITKTYTKNTTEQVTIKTKADKEIIKQIKIENIDKEAPKLTISKSPEEATNGDVTVTITLNEEVQEISGWTRSSDRMSLTKTYNQNATEEITVKDLLGNETTNSIEINNIDKTAPQLTERKELSQDKTQCTITIVANEEVQGISGWTRSSDKKTLTKTYKENGTETVTVTDMVGNKTSGQIIVTEIETVVEVTGYVVDVNYIKNIQPKATVDQFLKSIKSSKIPTIKEGNNSVSGTSKIKTGQVLVAGEKSYILVVKGDTNGDGEADLKDMYQINLHRLGKKQLNTTQQKAANTNNDSYIDLKDMLKINLYRQKKTSVI